MYAILQNLNEKIVMAPNFRLEVFQGVNIHKKMIHKSFQSKMILQIHDELLFECPYSEVEEFALMVKEEMEGAISLSVPLKVDWNYGSSWYKAH